MGVRMVELGRKFVEDVYGLRERLVQCGAIILIRDDGYLGCYCGRYLITRPDFHVAHGM